MTESPRRILVVSPAPTHPPTAGNSARILAMMEYLRRRGHEIHFVHLARQGGDNDAMRAYWGERFYSIPFRWPPRGQGRPQDRPGYLDWIRNHLKSRLQGTPFPVEECRLKRINQNALYRLRKYARALLDLNWTSKYNCLLDDWYRVELDRFLVDLKRKIDFDAVLVQYVFLSRALMPFDRRVLKIIDTHDVFSNRYRQYLAHGEEPVFFSCSPADEARALARADVVLAIQENERAYLLSLTRGKVIHVGHIVALHPPVACEAPRRILFVGSDNTSNVHGIRQFLDQAFPVIRARCPEVRLLVAGAVCRQVPDRPGCEKLGEIRNLDEIYSRADIIVNPRQFGTGLSIKSIEAMSWGRPLVSTAAGATGLEACAGSGYLPAEDPEAFAQAVLSLIEDKALYLKYATGAYRYAQAYNARVTGELNDVLRSGKKGLAGS